MEILESVFNVDFDEFLDRNFPNPVGDIEAGRLRRRVRQALDLLNLELGIELRTATGSQRHVVVGNFLITPSGEVMLRSDYGGGGTINLLLRAGLRSKHFPTNPVAADLKQYILEKRSSPLPITPPLITPPTILPVYPLYKIQLTGNFGGIPDWLSAKILKYAEKSGYYVVVPARRSGTMIEMQVEKRGSISLALLAAGVAALLILLGFITHSIKVILVERGQDKVEIEKENTVQEMEDSKQQSNQMLIDKVITNEEWQQATDMINYQQDQVRQQTDNGQAAETDDTFKTLGIALLAAAAIAIIGGQMK